VEGVVRRPASRVSFAKELALELVGGLPLFTKLPRANHRLFQGKGASHMVWHLSYTCTLTS
jgi:hypothetical protein